MNYKTKKGKKNMANVYVETTDGVSVRIDGAIVNGGKYLVEPYLKVDDDGKTTQRYFGSFRFENKNVRDEAERTLKLAIRALERKFTINVDTIFYGAYPKFEESDEYGTKLNCSNRVKFQTVSYEENGKPIFHNIEDNDITDYVYSLELTLKPTKDKEIFLYVNRAVIMKKLNRFNDELFSGDLSINEDDLPF